MARLSGGMCRASRLASATGENERARTRIPGYRLANASRREEALPAAAEAAEIRRRLAAARPDGFEPARAESLSNLGNRLADAGRREEALPAAAEAAEIRWRLAAARPDAFEPALATSLSPLSACRASRTSSLAETGSPAGRNPSRRTGCAIANSATSSSSQYTANSTHWLPGPTPRWSIS